MEHITTDENVQIPETPMPVDRPGVLDPQKRPRPDARSGFYFDGEFRSWPEIQHRVRLESVIESNLAPSPWGFR